MSRLIIEGGYPLCGVVEIQGAKNSILPILAATLLADGDCVIEKCPDITDTRTAVEILTALGASATIHSKYIVIDTGKASGYEIPDELMRQMRSSIMFLGAVLSRRGRARVSFPGGCDIGMRPIDLHISSLRKMGAEITESHGFLDCETHGLHGAEITLPFPSVGATENIMLAAAKANGKTVIVNAAREPEISDLQGFLNAMGARVSGAGTDTVTVVGVKRLTGVNYRIIPDRIVAATYMCAVAATRGNAVFKNVNPLHMSAVLSLMRDAGCVISEYEDAVSVECDSVKEVRTVNSIRTMPYPGFPTDVGSPFLALMCFAKGTTVFVETIFESRFKYIGELMRMGARIRTEGRIAVVDGVKRLYGTTVMAHDLRGGAALAVAGLAAEGTTSIDGAEYVLRGYEKIDSVLSDMGARITLMP